MSRTDRRSRRAFIGGAAATLALPFLESLAPRRANAADRRLRFLFYYVPNGFRMDLWTPAEEGAGFTLPPTLSPLAKVRQKLFVLGGLDNEPASRQRPGDHANGTAAFLTCAVPQKTGGLKLGISIDQAIAQAIGGATTFPSLQLGIHPGGLAGSCDSGFPCAYANNVSWTDERTPMSKVVDPQTVFDRLFEGMDRQASSRDQQRRLRQRASVLDVLRQDTERLQTRLGRTDRAKLDEFASGIRALEVRIQKGTAPAASCAPGARPSAGLPPYPEHVALMTDLMVLAFQCDRTRVITFMMQNATSERTYPFLNITGGHHSISHHGRRPENLAKLAVIDKWEMQQVATLLEKLDAIDDGGATLLDNTAVFFSSEIEDGDAHRHSNLPTVLAGSAGGAFKPGRHIRYARRTPIANLFLSLLQVVQPAAPRFADSTGPLDLG